MTYNELSPKDKRYYTKFRRIAEIHGVRDEEGVQDVVTMLSSPQMKSIPLISAIIALVAGFFAGKDMMEGGIPVILPAISILCLWITAQNIRTITTTIPMMARIYIEEDLPRKQKISKKKQKRIDAKTKAANE